MSILKEFKTFALKGNVLDMAVGIIIGASFSKIVDSLVKDIMMPFLALGLQKVDFSDVKIPLGTATINIGLFLNAVISFIIVAFAVFLLVKAINTLRAKMEKAEEKAAAAAAPTEKVCPYCCSKIPVGATRCPHCTSELKSKKKKTP